ncbi:hypothetical protein Clacol_002846 [Clathrus columnatus]|uniref:CWH43-like N-terminal domain-containing protein n=1 Tax=Clathrus columnatus TaxID=1419009 RepID=A0AAV5A1X0_9AGAM|nr:hypothetical protein Clacol_002846 [Clathrus columnatus]
MSLYKLSPLVPALGTVAWCGGLLAMIITWAAEGKPHYVSQQGSIPFISDIGAAERWFRHSGRLLPNLRQRERTFAILAIFGSTLGGVALILLSIFDTARHEKLHRAFLLIFMVGVALSAIFTCLEFRWLNRAHRGSKQLRTSYIAKGIIVFVLVSLSIGFGGALDARHNAADILTILTAVLEWVIGFGFTFYLLTFIIDLLVMEETVEDGESLWHNNGMRQQTD